MQGCTFLSNQTCPLPASRDICGRHEGTNVRTATDEVLSSQVHSDNLFVSVLDRNVLSKAIRTNGPGTQRAPIRLNEAFVLLAQSGVYNETVNCALDKR